MPGERHPYTAALTLQSLLLPLDSAEECMAPYCNSDCHVAACCGLRITGVPVWYAPAMLSHTCAQRQGPTIVAKLLPEPADPQIAGLLPVAGPCAQGVMHSFKYKA